MALGHTTRMILRKFLDQGLAIGLIGGIVGVALAWALATAISAVGIPMLLPPGMSKGYSGEIVFTWALRRARSQWRWQLRCSQAFIPHGAHRV